jgi:hypothetical protein
MPRHQNPDVQRPINDNVAHSGHEPAKHGKSRGGMKIPTELKPSHSPQASSMPGSLPIIKDPHQKSGMAHGISGIISSTTTSPETRQRLVSGILDLSMEAGHDTQGPIHSVMGHDSTAYNSGMVHIAGSHFTMHGSHQGDVKSMEPKKKRK